MEWRAADSKHERAFVDLCVRVSIVDRLFECLWLAFGWSGEKMANDAYNLALLFLAQLQQERTPNWQPCSIGTWEGAFLAAHWLLVAASSGHCPPGLGSKSRLKSDANEQE